MIGVTIKGIGIANPSRIVSSCEIDTFRGEPLGTTEIRTGIKQRRYSSNETAGELGVKAVKEALTHANFDLTDIDCIISASGTMEQAIPYNGANLHRLLGLKTPIPTFDINMTCLSAVAAINVANALIQNATYKNILLVSSEIASVGIDWNDSEVGGMFGDGAAAIIIGQSSNTSQRVLGSHFETHSEGYESCQIRGGGSTYHPSKIIDEDYKKYGLFEMHGKIAYRLTAKVMPAFLNKLLGKANVELNDIDWIVPHQASNLALEHLKKRLGVPEHKLINILSERGNQIAASIPTAMNELFKHRAIKSGDKVLIIGTSAGLSLGGLIMEL